MMVLKKGWFVTHQERIHKEEIPKPVFLHCCLVQRLDQQGLEQVLAWWL